MFIIPLVHADMPPQSTVNCRILASDWELPATPISIREPLKSGLLKPVVACIIVFVDTDPLVPSPTTSTPVGTIHGTFVFIV